ncbi:MAG: methyl-accepting chemotaxis protein [Gammaproteobacteria bacterium]|nr:methyl-accepting chemotaxis protein [Gammaproteobacteria bacterium]
MRRTQRLSWPVVLLIIGAVVALLFSAYSFVRAHQSFSAGSVALRSALSQQVLSERLLNLAADSSRRSELVQSIEAFAALQNSNTPAEVDQAWQDFRHLLPNPDSKSTVPATELPDFSPVVEKAEALASWLEKTEAPEAQLESAGHLLQLAHSVAARLEQSTDGNSQSLSARGPWLVFAQILNRFELWEQNGSITDADSLKLLGELRASAEQSNLLFDASLAELNARASRPEPQQLTSAQSALNSALAKNITMLTTLQQQPDRWYQSGLLSALASLVLLSLLAIALWRDVQTRNRKAQALYQRDQASILRLLDEISVLADGDLDVQATVSEDLTGAIADSVNYAVSELRRLVGAITNSADRVTVAVEETGASASQLAKAGVVQSREIQRSSAYLKAMSDTMTQMSERSREASGIASRSVKNAVEGRQSIEKTLDGMNRISGQIQQTAGLLNRLSESSQQIGDIVALINKAASKTRLLALNAAIQSNGQDTEKQQGMSRIANEVQSLSDSLKHSTHDIEVLVQIIQEDSRSAMLSMDHTAAEVTAGVKQVEHAGDAHRDIETISRRLSVVVEHLAQKTGRQSDVVTQLAANMSVINDVTRQSAHGMQLSASALEDLRRMATELRDGVADFVMPAQHGQSPRHVDIVSRPLLKKKDYLNSADDTDTLAGTEKLEAESRKAIDISEQ